jgi:molybdopterin converting factor small subunit
LKTVEVEYYALLREERGAGRESVATEAKSLRALYEELRARHGFSLDTDRLRVAVNSEFRDWSTAPAEGDTVVFIPPVAGG